MDKDSRQFLQDLQRAHVEALSGFLRDCSDVIVELATVCAEALVSGKKLMFCGNGGSACDSMHIAGEFVGRFIKNRVALPAIALTADSGILTCIANDYSYEEIFSRQVEAIGQTGMC